MHDKETSLDSAFRSQSSRDLKTVTEKRAHRPDINSFILSQRIPEGVGVIAELDSNTPKLPLFGQRVAPESRSKNFMSRAPTGSSTTSLRPGAELRIHVDQLEHELRQKMQGAGSLSLKKMFKSNNPEEKATVKRLHLSEKAVISFDELCSAIQEPVLTGPATWLSPAQPPSPGYLQRASQALALLRGPARGRFLAAVESLPAQEPRGPGWIVAPELKQILEQLEIHLEESEFEKLWKRFDIDTLGAVKLKVLLKKLGLCKRHGVDTKNKNIPKTSIPSQSEDLKTAGRSRTLSKAEESRQFSITVETWLKDKFCEGAEKMKAEFERLDPVHSGKVGAEEFLQVLHSFNLSLKRQHLGLFLARCGMELHKDSIDYLQFLHRFQDRNEDSLMHSILSNPKHRFHQENISHASSITAVEAKVTQLFQSEYLSLLQTFQSIDKFNKRSISQEEFRAAVESRLHLEISDPEFEQLLDRLPLDAHGNVQYLIFLATFDTSLSAFAIVGGFIFIHGGDRGVKPAGGGGGKEGESESGEILVQDGCRPQTKLAMATIDAVLLRGVASRTFGHSSHVEGSTGVVGAWLEECNPVTRHSVTLTPGALTTRAPVDTLSSLSVVETLTFFGG
ncbi:hypothetical protein ACEWY4_007283 [Coilia grayii]|uniref:EF-hand domain-containing protein n=1 Tax=Coilia grayii TaxID=363190 RepID=A0ABD1KGA2_9TELE